MHDMPPWVVPAVIGGGLLVLAIVVLFLWLNSRGRFMFTDCIVRNRGAIAEPWREFRTEGNRYFVVQLVVAFCSMITFGGLALIFVFGWYWNNPIFPLPLLILLGVILFLIAVVIGLIMKFMVPVMYRQRCDAMDAFRSVWQLIAANPGLFLLFGLFYVVLCIAGAMVGCLAACVTCCIAALPYIGTVILLPVVMFLFAYPLCFIRQFGDPYDVWAVVRPDRTAAPATVSPADPGYPPARLMNPRSAPHLAPREKRWRTLYLALLPAGPVSPRLRPARLVSALDSLPDLVRGDDRAALHLLRRDPRGLPSPARRICGAHSITTGSPTRSLPAR